MRILDLETYLEIMKQNKLEKYNEKKSILIFNLLENNPKLRNFIETKFLEIFVKRILSYRHDIVESKNHKQNRPFYDPNKSGIRNTVELSEEEFRRIAERITLDSIHLDEKNINIGVEAYRILKQTEELYSEFCELIMMQYAYYIYENRYQLRKYIDKGLTLFKKDIEGDYLIDDDYIVKDNNDGGKNSPFWISVEGMVNKKSEFKNDIVVKNMFKDNKKHTALVAEEIARQLHLPVAQYYPAKYVGQKYKTKKDVEVDSNIPFVSENIVITPNFLEDGEELITGDRIVRYDMDIENAPDLIRAFFKKYNLSEDEISQLITDYRIIMMYNCFINHRDCHSGNWGFIRKKDGSFKIAHIFDLEGSLTENTHKIRAIYVGDYFDDEHLLKSLLRDPKVLEKARRFLELQIDTVFLNVYKTKGVKVSKVDRKEIRYLIYKQKELLTKVINEIENEKLRAENER